MEQLLAAETSDRALKTRLSSAFNGGYHSGRAMYPKCSLGARAEGRRIATLGKWLSEKL